jgi:hypothetical protein
MKDRITSALKTWITLWPDIWAAPIALVGLWLSYYFLTWIDPTIGTFDMGTLQALLFTVVILVVLNAVVFLGIEHNDKALWEYYKRGFDSRNEAVTTDKSDEQDFINITAWQRLKLLYFWRAFLFVLGVVIFVNLI